MRRFYLMVFLLAGAALGCNFGTPPLVPTVAPTFVLPTPTFFLVLSPTPFVQPTFPPVYPTSPPVGPCITPTGWAPYVVQPGDTLSALALRTGTTTAVLMQANCLTNANLISVGQVLWLPRTPAPPTATPGGPVSQTMLITAQPATFVNGQFLVAPAPVTIFADFVTTGVRVTFYYAYGNGTRQILGESPIIATRAQIGFNAATMPTQTTVNITAVALNSVNQVVQNSNVAILVRSDSPIVATATAPAPPTSTSAPLTIGQLSISPAVPVNDPGLRYKVQAGMVIIALSSVQNATTVSFNLFTAQNAEPITLGVVNNPGAGMLSISWLVQCPPVFSGRLIATATNSIGQAVSSNGLDVFCDGT